MKSKMDTLERVVNEYESQLQWTEETIEWSMTLNVLKKGCASSIYVCISHHSRY